MHSWYVTGVFAAIAIGFVASRFHLWRIAPVGLLSIAIGSILGALLGCLAAYNCVNCRLRLVLGTIVLAAVTVLAEHAWLYRDFRRQWHEARVETAEVAMFRPETPWSPAEYFAREASAGRIALWMVDAMLIVSAATATAVVTRGYAETTRVANDAAKSSPLNPEP